MGRSNAELKILKEMSDEKATLEPPASEHGPKPGPTEHGDELDATLAKYEFEVAMGAMEIPSSALEVIAKVLNYTGPITLAIQEWPGDARGLAGKIQSGERVSGAELKAAKFVLERAKATFEQAKTLELAGILSSGAAVGGALTKTQPLGTELSASDLTVSASSPATAQFESTRAYVTPAPIRESIGATDPLPVQREEFEALKHELRAEIGAMQLAILDAIKSQAAPQGTPQAQPTISVTASPSPPLGPSGHGDNAAAEDTLYPEPTFGDLGEDEEVESAQFDWHEPSEDHPVDRVLLKLSKMEPKAEEKMNKISEKASTPMVQLLREKLIPFLLNPRTSVNALDAILADLEILATNGDPKSPDGIGTRAGPESPGICLTRTPAAYILSGEIGDPTSILSDWSASEQSESNLASLFGFGKIPVHVKKLECYRDLAFLPDEFEAEVKTAINKMNAGFFKGRVVEDSDGRRIQFVALDGAQSTFVRQIVKGQLRVVDALERVTTEVKAAYDGGKLSLEPWQLDTIIEINQRCELAKTGQGDFGLPINVIVDPLTVALAQSVKRLYAGTSLINHILMASAERRLADIDWTTRYFGPFYDVGKIKDDETIRGYLERMNKVLREMEGFKPPVELTDLDIAMAKTLDGRPGCHPFLNQKFIIYMTCFLSYHQLPLMYRDHQTVRWYITKEVLGKAAKGLLRLQELELILDDMTRNHVGLPGPAGRVLIPRAPLRRSQGQQGGGGGLGAGPSAAFAVTKPPAGKDFNQIKQEKYNALVNFYVQKTSKTAPGRRFEGLRVTINEFQRYLMKKSQNNLGAVIFVSTSDVGSPTWDVSKPLAFGPQPASSSRPRTWGYLELGGTKPTASDIATYLFLGDAVGGTSTLSPLGQEYVRKNPRTAWKLGYARQPQREDEVLVA